MLELYYTNPPLWPTTESKRAHIYTADFCVCLNFGLFLLSIPPIYLFQTKKKAFVHHLKKKVFETQTKKKGTLCIGHPGTELCGGGGELYMLVSCGHP